MPDDASWISGGDGAFGDVAGYDRSRANYGISTDGDALEDNCSGSDEDVVCNSNRGRSNVTEVIGETPVCWRQGMKVCVGHDDFGPEQAAIPDRHMHCSTYGRPTDSDVSANFDRGALLQGAQHTRSRDAERREPAVGRQDSSASDRDLGLFMQVDNWPAQEAHPTFEIYGFRP